MVKLFAAIDPSAKVLPPPHQEDIKDLLHSPSTQEYLSFLQKFRRVFDDEPSEEDEPAESEDKFGERIRSVKMKSLPGSKRKQKAKVEAGASTTKRKSSKPMPIVKADGGNRTKPGGENLSSGNLMLRKSTVSPQRKQTKKNGPSTDHNPNCHANDEKEDVILNNICRRPRNPRMCVGIKNRSTNSV